jgi:fucokinase
MTRDTEQLQRIWRSTAHEWNRKRLEQRRRRPFWDVAILTAANVTQARGFELEMKRRREIGMIDPQTRVLVVPDRAGKRIGSGGATLWALKRYAQAVREDRAAPKDPEGLFRGKRVLLMHCGGEGRRVPSNAGAGKLFATLPFEVAPGRAASAFDALYVFLCACAGQMTEGLVVVSGDVLAVFDPAELHWRRQGCSGIGIPAPLELAARHGIYVPDPSGRRVAQYLQKLRPEQMRAQGATWGKDRALVDGAGILKFAPEISASLARLAGVQSQGGQLAVGPGLIESRGRRGEPVDLYTDIAWPMAPGMSRADYFAAPPGGKTFVRRQLWDALRGAEFWLDVVETSVFVHLGNLWEILQAFGVDKAGGQGRLEASGDAAAIFGRRHILASYVGAKLQVDPRAHIQNSFLDGATGVIGPHCLVAECRLAGKVELGARVFLRGVESDADLRVSDETALFAIPLLGARGAKPQTAYCVHGVGDNPKESAEQARFLGRSLNQWLKKRGIAEGDIWPRECLRRQRSLWNARLHPVGGPEALDLALWMQSPRGKKDDLSRRWRRSRRVSFAEIFERIDYQAGFRQREALIHHSLLARIRRDLHRRRDAREYFQSVGTAGEFVALRHALREWSENATNPLIAARVQALEAELLTCREFDLAIRRAETKAGQTDASLHPPARRRRLSIETRDASLRKVAEAVASGVARTQALDLGRVAADRVDIESPARIDFGGGWTDTPPQCLERGGVILSAAIRLNGRCPIGVLGEKIDERVIRLESAEGRRSEILRTAEDLPRFQRLDDPCGLAKAGLSAVGLCSLDSPGTPRLEERLEDWGHGLRIVTRSNVPKGSGLGTSSILGAAVIACLRRLFGASLDVETIFRQVLYLEQLLTSGGGWQDQIGALVPGIKLAAVPPSPDFVLRPTIEPLALDKSVLDEMNKRLVLFYVGKRRVAFNMLRDIVGGYLAGAPDVVHALQSLHDLAYEQREALRQGDFERFGAQMTRVRMLYRSMCPGTTSDLLESIFAAAAPYVSGGKCVGAGGGGFTAVMARSAQDARRVRERLKEFSWRGLGEFYDFDIDMTGLREVKT